jgi:hypothetical protein
MFRIYSLRPGYQELRWACNRRSLWFVNYKKCTLPLLVRMHSLTSFVVSPTRTPHRQSFWIHCIDHLKPLVRCYKLVLRIREWCP